jgi:hypothetical protein
VRRGFKPVFPTDFWFLTPNKKGMGNVRNPLLKRTEPTNNLKEKNRTTRSNLNAQTLTINLDEVT